MPKRPATMTDPILRPPVLNVENPSVQNQNPSVPNQNSSVSNQNQSIPNTNVRVNATPELESLIAVIASRVCMTECRNLVQSIVNPDNQFQRATDETIHERFRSNLSDLDKVPDVVRCLREFSGTPGEFSSWRKAVERVLNIYNQFKGTPKYFGILNIIPPPFRNC